MLIKEKKINMEITEMKTIEFVPFNALRNTETGRNLLRILFRAGRYEGRIDSKQAKAAYEYFIGYGKLEGIYESFYLQAKDEYYKAAHLGGIPGPVRRAGPEQCLNFLKGRHWSHITSYSQLNKEGNVVRHRYPSNGIWETGKINIRRGAKEMTKKELRYATTVNRLEAKQQLIKEYGEEQANKLIEETRSHYKHKKQDKVTTSELEVLNLEQTPTSIITLRIKQAISKANKAAVAAGITTALITSAVEIIKLYPKFVRGEINQAKFENQIGHIIGDALKRGFKVGAMAWVITFVTTLFKISLGGTASFISMLLGLTCLPKLAAEVKDIINEYKLTFQVTSNETKALKPMTHMTKVYEPVTTIQNLTNKINQKTIALKLSKLTQEERTYVKGIEDIEYEMKRVLLTKEHKLQIIKLINSNLDALEFAQKLQTISWQYKGSFERLGRALRIFSNNLQVAVTNGRKLAEKELLMKQRYGTATITNTYAPKLELIFNIVKGLLENLFQM